MSNVMFVHWEARMLSSDKSCDSFHSTGANGCLDFSLSLLAACGSVSWPCRMWPGSKKLRLTKESVAPWYEAQLAGCLRELESCPLEWDVGIE